MQITCKCLNVTIYTRGSMIDNYDPKSKGINSDHPFFKDNIGCVEQERILKEQTMLVGTEICNDWLVHTCLNCGMNTHATNNDNPAIVLVNRTLLTNPQEISALKSSKKFSPVFHIIIDHDKVNADNPLSSGMRPSSGILQQQLNEWLQRETSQTEERVRQYSEQQYAALDGLHSRAHKDLHALSRILSKATITVPEKSAVQATLIGNPPPSRSVLQPLEPTKVANKPKNVIKKDSEYAGCVFDMEDMDEAVEALPSDEELSDTDESGSHDEGIHIPRHATSSMYAKSLPVNVPIFMQNLSSDESHHRVDYRVPQDPLDIAASIKALAKSVHGDAVFGDLPRPRFCSNI